MAVIAVFLTGCVLMARAQDTQYWTHQYGTRATLLGGAVIGSVLDLSGTYYNPGGLALIDTEDVDLLMVAKVFHYPSITFRGSGAADIKLNSSALGEAPSLVAGSLPFKWLKGHWLGYSFLNRHEVKLGMSGTLVGTLDVAEGIPGEEPTALDLRLSERLSEPWYGFTWAYRVSPAVGIGVTQYFSFRSHSTSYQTLAQVLAPDGHVKMALDSREYKYDTVGALWKLGAAFDFKRLTLGLTVTTPSVKLYGDGRVGRNTTIILQEPDNPETPDIMLADFQKGLPADYKNPWSVGLGATIKIGSTNVYTSAEWFSGLDEYVVVKGSDFEGQTSGDILPNQITHELDDVLNFGLGLEQILSPSLTLYGSFWTDFSAHKPNSTSNLSVTDWDIYHIMTGSTFTFLKSQWTLGVGYSYGARSAFTGDRAQSPGLRLIAQRFFKEAGFSYSSFRWILGFSF